MWDITGIIEVHKSIKVLAINAGTSGNARIFAINPYTENVPNVYIRYGVVVIITDIVAPSIPRTPS